MHGAFVDSDRVIEQRLGMSIKVFFEREGEQAFRDLEEQVLAELLQDESTPCVLATGGGAVLRPGSRERMRSSGWKVVYLHATPGDLLRRVRHDTSRPLLQVADPFTRLLELHAQRDPLYREVADFVIETWQPSVATLVNTIMMQLELAAPPRS